TTPRPPADFAPVLATEKPLLLVGGQAVNLWALYYREHTAELAPFVSHDVDVLGDRETLEMLGKLAGVKPQFFPLRPPSNEVGVVIAKDTAGQPMLIEVLRYVHGVGDKELREPIYTLAIGEGQVRVQVPGPIALLQAKIANVADLKQTGRQDARHVRILVQLMPGYLKDLKRATAEGSLEERKLIELAERLLAVVTTAKARKIFGQLQLDPRGLFARLDAEQLTKLRAFLEKRMPRALSG
ncbi:MAG: hypothetical protein WCL04_10035, partial [Verrucomicrobiota bacterium]